MKFTIFLSIVVRPKPRDSISSTPNLESLARLSPYRYISELAVELFLTRFTVNNGLLMQPRAPFFLPVVPGNKSPPDSRDETLRDESFFYDLDRGKLAASLSRNNIVHSGAIIIVALNHSSNKTFRAYGLELRDASSR